MLVAADCSALRSMYGWQQGLGARRVLKAAPGRKRGWPVMGGNAEQNAEAGQFTAPPCTK